MNLKLYLVLFTIAVSTILLLNSGVVAQVKAEGNIYKYDGNKFVQVPGELGQIAVGADGISGDSILKIYFVS